MIIRKHIMNISGIIRKRPLAMLFSAIVLAGAILGSLFVLPKKVYTFEQDNTLVLNPYIGWVTDARATDIRQPHTLVYASFSWRDIEKDKGNYDFSSFEERNHFAYWASKDVRIIIRLYLDYPQDSPHRDIPDWLYDELGGAGVAYANSYGAGFSPDYDAPLLLQYHERLINAIAARYDNDPAIAFVELGSLGHWGEWHTGENNGVQIPFASQAACEAVAGHYAKYFRNKILLMRRPTRMAAEHNMGLFNDSFGDMFQTEDYFINWFTHGYVDLQTGVQNPPMREFWRKAPSGGEVANNPGEQYFTNENMERTLRQLKLSHTSWLGPSGPFYSTSSEVAVNLDVVQNSMGYKFYISRAALGKNLSLSGKRTLQITMKNSGIAPFYYRWPVRLYIMDFNNSIKYVQTAEYDIRTLMPNGSGVIRFSVPEEYQNNAFKAFVGIADPSTDKPAIHFANKGNSDLFYICDLG